MGTDNLAGLNIKTPKIIIGSSGRYYEVARSGDGERSIYLRFKFERDKITVDGKTMPIQSVNVNVLYFGPQFELMEPFTYVDTRKYKTEDGLKHGAIIGKFQSPMGQFNFAPVPMHEWLRDKLSVPMMDLLTPVLKATGCDPIQDLSMLFDFMLEGLSEEPLILEPKLMNMREYKAWQITQDNEVDPKFKNWKSDSGNMDPEDQDQDLDL